jgi:hypothetical protein
MARETTESSFDELARGLANGSISRGRAIRLMGAALVGGTLASLGIGGVAGADPPGCKRNGKHCKNNSQCCSDNCAANGTCAACPDGRVLLDNGTCAKPCTTNDDYADCGGDEQCVQGSISGESFCAVGLGSRAPCMNDSQCTTPGEFCNPGQCVAAC